MIEIYLLLPLTVLKLISYSLIPLKAVPTITTLMPVRHRISKLTKKPIAPLDAMRTTVKSKTLPLKKLSP